MNLPTLMDRVVILARGLGTRMRRKSEAHLSPQQMEMAERGIKALIPIDKPFLDYVLLALQQAGYHRVCLVIGPEHDVIREYYSNNFHLEGVDIEFAIQIEALGTANAVLAAQEWVAGDPFLMINSDNYYPPEALAALRFLPGPGLAAFDRHAMLTGSNIPPERIRQFALLQIDQDGFLEYIHEKPSPELLAELKDPVYLSMNCWRFDINIFEACRRIGLSPRGEYEITDAVAYAITQLDVRFKTVPIALPVLDLSSKDDVEPVTLRLREICGIP